LNITETEMSYDVFMKIALHTPQDKKLGGSVFDKKEAYELA